MDRQKTEEYFKKLEQHCASITAEYSLVEHNGSYIMRSVFTTIPGGLGVVHYETDLVQMREDSLILEVEVVPNIELEPENYIQLEQAVMHLNYYLPLGYFDIFYPLKKLFYRYTARIDETKSADELVAETGIVYELIANVVGSVYQALEQVNDGTLTFEEAVEKGLLLRQK